MNKHTSRVKRKELILKTLRKMKEATCNEIINKIHDDFVDSGKIKDAGWRFFVHLNKFPAPMEKSGLIEFTGKMKLGELGRMEKVWRVKND
jgi:hypothetical protein